MIWEHPAALWLLILLIGGYFALGYYQKIIRDRRKRYFSDEVFDKLYHGSSPGARKAQNILLFTGLVFLVFALAGPKIGTEVREITRQGVDLMIMLDVSKSMKAEDVRPNRLDKAKFEILRMVDRLRGDRIGLIVFTGESVLLSPLTADYSAFRLYLNLADTDAMPSSTTDFSAGFEVALQAFKSAGQQDRNTSRVMLLLSDGEDHGPDYSQSLQQIRDLGVTIFTVGIGTTSGGTIPIYDEQTGRLREYLRDAAGQIVTTRLEPQNLRRIADTGGGQYFEISRSSDGMDGFISQLEELEKSEFATQEFADYKNQYQWFAAFGLILLLLSISIPHIKPLE